MAARIVPAILAVTLLAAAPASADLKLTPIATFNLPVYVAAPPRDPHRLFVVEKAGRVMLVLDGVKQADPFLDLTGSVVSASE